MKLQKSIYLLLVLFIVNINYSQTEPDKKTTLAYITKIFNETSGYEFINDGIQYKIKNLFFNEPGNTGNISYNAAIEIKENYISFGQLAPSGYCSFGYKFKNIDWAKMRNIYDANATSVASNSPVKLLGINFTPNSILREGHTNYKCNAQGYKYLGETQSVGFILFPYRDEEGVKERLIRAFNHLSKLAKEEQAKNDPFGN